MVDNLTVISQCWLDRKLSSWTHEAVALSTCEIDLRNERCILLRLVCILIKLTLGTHLLGILRHQSHITVSLLVLDAHGLPIERDAVHEAGALGSFTQQTESLTLKKFGFDVYQIMDNPLGLLVGKLIIVIKFAPAIQLALGRRQL